MCRRLIHVKGDLNKMAADNSKMAGDLKKKMADQANEMRSLKEINLRLTDDNQVSEGFNKEKAKI